MSLYGFIAYSAYCQNCKGKHPDGSMRCHWDDLPDVKRQVWSNVASAVITAMTKNANLGTKTTNEPGRT